MISEDALLTASPYEQSYQKEKDYVEELFLSGIYNKFDDLLIFKGGTALSKFYGSHRFSDDLDFSILRKGSEAADLEARFGDVISKVSESYNTKVLRKLTGKTVLKYELSVRGPLFDALNKYQHLKIEVDRTVSVLEPVLTLRKNPRYQDVSPYIAVVLNEKEILAEKIVALMFRHNPKARDLYDLYFLIKKGTEIKVSLIDKKMREFGHAFEQGRLNRRIEIMGTIWTKELDRLVQKKERVDYLDAKRLVAESLKNAGL